MEFKIGDKVSWFGIEGLVVFIDHNTQIKVNFENVKYVAWFYQDGKEHTWHKEPALKLIERPKKKVNKGFWVNVYQFDSSEMFSFSSSYSNESEALRGRKKTGYKTTIPIILEVEEE